MNPYLEQPRRRYRHARWAGLVNLLALWLGLVIGGPAQAFECANSGAGDQTTQNDGGITTRIACGQSAAATGTFGTAVGADAAASGSDSTAVGGLATASGENSTAVGRSALASGSSRGRDRSSSTAVGRNATASGDFNTTLGFDADAFSPHTNAAAIGYQALVGQSNAMVLGSIPGVNSGTDYVDLGNGTTTPLAPLHIQRQDDTFEFLFLDSDLAGSPQDRPMMQLVNNGGIRFQFDNTALGTAWRFQAATGNQDNFEIAKVGTGQIELLLDGTGNLTIQGVLDQNSNVHDKEGIKAVDAGAILSSVLALDLSEWSYRGESARHLGPMAQNFHAAFGLGADETKLAPGDLAGIALAAIQGQQEIVQEQQARIETLAAQNEQLQASQAARDEQIALLQSRLAAVDELRVELAALRAELSPAVAMD